MRVMVDLSTDVVIVGAGPIGLELAVALKLARVDYLQFDAKQVGYTISWFPPQTRFFSSNERIAIAGVPLITADGMKATREEYLAYLRGVVVQFDLKVHKYEPVIDIQRDGQSDARRGGGGGVNSGGVNAGVLESRAHNDGSVDGGGFIVRTAHHTVRCNKLVLATGGTDRPRKLNIPGEDLPHVQYYFRDPHDYFRQRVVVIGGKNSAVEAALRCYHGGGKITLSYRRDALPDRSIKYWLWPEITGLIDSGKIDAYFNSNPIRITPTHVTLQRGSETWDVPADFVLALIGYEQDNTLFKKAGLPLEGSCQAPRFDPQTMETPIKNLYVAGTSIGGTQDKYSVFIENCHVHVERIVAALTGHHERDHRDIEYLQPES